MTFSEFRGQSADKQLQSILDYFFEQCQVPASRRIPIFLGTLIQPMKIDWYTIGNIRLLGEYPVSSLPFSDVQPTVYLPNTRKIGLDGKKVIFTLQIDPKTTIEGRFLVAKHWAIYELVDNSFGVLYSAYTQYSKTIYSDLSTQEQALALMYLQQDAEKELKEKLAAISDLRAQESHYQAVVADYKRLEGERANILHDLDELQQQLPQLKEHHSDLSNQVTEANRVLTELQKQNQSLSSENGKLERRKSTLAVETEKAEQVYSAASKQSQSAQDELNRLRAEAASLTEQIAFYTSGIRIEDYDALPLMINEPKDRNWIRSVFNRRFDYFYDEDLLRSFLSALNTNQIITLFGKPGTGKTTFVSQMATALGAKCSIIDVQNNWTDSADILGYYNPIDHTYQSTPFLEAILDAYAEWNNPVKASRLHIICLDEMNLARVEYYFATFLSMLQLPQNKRVLRLLPRSLNEEIDSVYQKHKKNEQLSSEEMKLFSMRCYRDFLLPPNIRFVGTINNDDTTNPLSPKVMDRSIFIEIKANRIQDRGWQGSQQGISGYYPSSQFALKPIGDKGESEIQTIFSEENFRLKDYIREMWIMFQKLGYTSVSDFADIIISTKILPRVASVEAFSRTEYCDEQKYTRAYNAFRAHVIDGIEAYNYLGG